MAEFVVKVERIFEEIRPTRTGDLVTQKVVTYFVGDHGPFQHRIPTDAFDPDAVKAALEVEADKVRKLFGG